MILAKKLTTLTIIGAAACLALTGCSGDGATDAGSKSGGGSSGSVYEFQTNGIAPSDEVTIQLPDDLRKAMGPEADGLIVDKIVAKGHKLDGVEHCAVDLKLTYAKGQPDQILKSNSAEAHRAEREDELIRTLDVSSLDEVAKLLDQSIADDARKGRPPGRTGEGLNTLTRTTIGDDYQPGDTGKELIDRYLDKPSNSTDAQAVARSLSADGTVRAESELDKADAESGTYVSDDFKKLTLVDDCAASATDPDNTMDLTLKRVEADGDDEGVADVDLSVMTDGTIGVAGEVADYQRDANDNWIAS